jgi:predicted AlkP superfamily pyrophosphatase or phosphodiesterase
MEGYWKDRQVAYTLAEFAQSLFASLGLSDCLNPLKLEEQPSGRHCVLLVDGMGKNAVDDYSQDLEISRLNYRQTLQATFPSTTATSLTSFGTGRAPGEHGMVGYTMLVPHSGSPERILNALKWDERIDPMTWQSVPTLFERGVADGIAVTHIAGKRYANTGFTRAALRGASYVGVNTPEEMVAAAERALQKERSFAYLYVNDVDEASHGSGFGSERFQVALRKVADLILQLKRELPSGTTLWVTSDHGMINRGEAVVIGRENPLLNGIRALAGEPRVRYLYLVDQESTEVMETWREFLGEKVTIYSRDEAIAQGLFGASVSARSAERIGDLVVIANQDLILVEIERAAQQLAMVGHHGGVTKAEVEIPLLFEII